MGAVTGPNRKGSGPCGLEGCEERGDTGLWAVEEWGGLLTGHTSEPPGPLGLSRSVLSSGVSQPALHFLAVLETKPRRGEQGSQHREKQKLEPRDVALPLEED